VSRPTVRTALRALDARGLTVTMHGVGTFATAATKVVSADLHRLESISETIVRMGRTPSSSFRSVGLRAATEEERVALAAEPGAQVLAIEREILADGETVAYGHDVVPAEVLPPGFDIRTMDGSLFAFLERHGITVRSSLANVHSSRGEEIGWGDHADAVYLLLEQTHFDERDRSVAYSHTWFIEGRFQFTIIRVR
jgi:GntR family transcriptional regulator